MGDKKHDVLNFIGVAINAIKITNDCVVKFEKL